MKKIIVANWKLNPSTISQAVRLAKDTIWRGSGAKNAKIVIVPPFVFLESVSKVLKYKEAKRLKANLGAQDVFWEENGAYTGEISPSQLKSFGVKYVIIGHSERRALGEIERQINKKVKAALKAGLKVILCVGESLLVRKKGSTVAKRFVRQQLLRDLRGLSKVKGQMSNVIIAYEPIWAISSVSGGKSDTPEDAVLMIRFVKKILNSKPYTLTPKVLYGGSVNAKNAKSFLEKKEIDGALVGGASLRAREFGKIVRAA